MPDAQEGKGTKGRGYETGKVTERPVALTWAPSWPSRVTVRLALHKNGTHVAMQLGTAYINETVVRGRCVWHSRCP